MSYALPQVMIPPFNTSTPALPHISTHFHTAPQSHLHGLRVGGHVLRLAPGDDLPADARLEDLVRVGAAELDGERHLLAGDKGLERLECDVTGHHGHLAGLACWEDEREGAGVWEE
jgi:hypothetical protein